MVGCLFENFIGGSWVIFKSMLEPLLVWFTLCLVGLQLGGIG
jgi:hypothetical protein